MSTTKVSYSQLVTHRQCPQKWAFAYQERLEKDDPEDARVELEFGNWWHALRAADSIERGREAGTLASCPEEIRTVDHGPTIPTATDRDPQPALVWEVMQAAGKWWKSLTEEIQQVWMDRLGSPLVDRLTYVDSRYRERWDDSRQEEQPVAVETWWTRDLPTYTVGDTVIETGATLVGVVDEVYLDTKRGLLVARDHKAHRTLAQQSAVDNMMDSQLQLYAWGLSPLVKSWDLGKIDAIAYDRVRMVAPKAPSVTQSGTLSKSVTDYDLHTYVQWSKGPNGEGVPYPGRKKDGSGAGLYQPEDKVVEKLSAPQARAGWFQRTLTPLNLNLIRIHLQAAVDSAYDLNLSQARIGRSGEATRNLTKDCKWCDFASLCRARMVGGPSGEYDLTEHRLRRK